MPRVSQALRAIMESELASLQAREPRRVVSAALRRLVHRLRNEAKTMQHVAAQVRLGRRQERAEAHDASDSDYNPSDATEEEEEEEADDDVESSNRSSHSSCSSESDSEHDKKGTMTKRKRQNINLKKKCIKHLRKFLHVTVLLHSPDLFYPAQTCYRVYKQWYERQAAKSSSTFELLTETRFFRALKEDFHIPTSRRHGNARCYSLPFNIIVLRQLGLRPNHQ